MDPAAPLRAPLRVLGECRIGDAVADAPADPRPTAPLTETQRRILSRLALDAPSTVPLEALVEAVWGEDAPVQHRASLQNQVSRLRARYGEDLVETSPAGYSLGRETDAQRLIALGREAEVRLAAGDAEAAFALAEEAVLLWRGTPFAELDHVPAAVSARRVLAAARHGAEDLRAEAAIELGRTAWAVVEAERLAEAAPFDERRQAFRIRALLRAGRRGEAVAAAGAARRRFREELGVDPGPLVTAAEAEAFGADPAGGRTAGRLPFEGRERELRRVLAELARVSLVRVTGEPGCGVTRLLTAVAAQLHALGVRTLSIDAADHLTSAAGVLTALVDPGTGLADDARGVVAGFADAIARMAERAPVAILVDDAGSLGSSARGALAEASARDRVMVLLGDHGGTGSDGPDAGGCTVVLPPLGRDAVTRLAAAATGRALDPDEVDRLISFSGGNPLLIESAFLAGWPIDQGDLGAGGLGPGGLGPGGEAAASRQGSARVARWAEELLGGLGGGEREALRRAAVAGDDFPAAVILAEGDIAVPPSSLLALAEGKVRFVHGALREQILRGIPPAQREDLHAVLGRAAAAAGADPVLVAHHLLRAADLVPAEAIAAGREAAAEASRAGTHADAAEWLSRCLAVRGSAAAERLGLRIELGDAQRLAGDPGHLGTLISAVSEALDLGDGALISAACFALLQLGATSTSGTPLPQIPPLIERSLTMLTEPETRAPVCAAASLAHSLVGDADRSRAYFAEAAAIAVSDEDRARVLPFAYMALGAPEELAARTAAAEELALIGARLGSAPASYEAEQLRFSIALQTGEGEAARAAVEGMGALIDHVGDVGRRWALLFARAAVAHLDGDVARSRELAAQAEALFAPVSPARASVAHLGQLIAIHLARGDMSVLAPLLRQTTQQLPGIPALHAAAALALVGEAPAEAAEHAVLALDRAQRDATWLAAHVIGARAAARLGQAEVVRRYLDALRPWSGRGVWQGTCSYGPVDTALALLHRARGDEGAVAEHAALADGLAQRLGARPFQEELIALGLTAG